MSRRVLFDDLDESVFVADALLDLEGPLVLLGRGSFAGSGLGFGEGAVQLLLPGIEISKLLLLLVELGLLVLHLAADLQQLLVPLDVGRLLG